MTLQRLEYKSDGIFGRLLDDAGGQIAVTLEHSYDSLPKIPKGVYTCIRGQHKLHGMTDTFETFEITGVAGHTNLLFHWGNYNSDSEGCVLLGQSRVGDMVATSKVTFAKFMQQMDGINQFQLTVQ